MYISTVYMCTGDTVLYKDLIVVYISWRRGPYKCFGMTTLALVLVKGMVKQHVHHCIIYLHQITISTHYIHTTLNHAYPHQLVKHIQSIARPVIAWPSLKETNYGSTHSLSSGGLSSNLVWYTCVDSNKSSENRIYEWHEQTDDRSNCTYAHDSNYWTAVQACDAHK